ncbi:GNAT family N-acetyltransferase [Streptomyces melanogenes]|uniref:GNAT family N-acetyltransferase n=1 Tax=Streptomyces melanogenes TaxID=67326 RepID=A0ABZ1XW13_9ACTN|nr:GNAT family N-acetyltransferase [Streptomyces melanogenes]
MTATLARPTPHTRVLVDTAAVDDVPALRSLYHAVYGDCYPLRLGTDPVAMAAAMTDPTVKWRVARDIATGDVVGSALLRTDVPLRIGKVEGIAVDPGHAGAGIGGALLEALMESAFGAEGGLDSVYATARCVSPAPQRLLLRHGFHPLGVLPGAVTLREVETLALLVRYRDGIPANRRAPGTVPQEVAPLLEAARGHGVHFDDIHAESAPVPPRTGAGTDLDVSHDPGLVLQRYAWTPSGAARTLPLHLPNTLLASPDGRFEAYAVIDAIAGNGLLLEAHSAPDEAPEALGDVLRVMAERGADYIEAMLPLHDRTRIERHLAHGFTPTALYPAMRREDGVWHDYVLLSHTTARVDADALRVDDRFSPYVRQHSHVRPPASPNPSDTTKRG